MTKEQIAQAEEILQEGKKQEPNAAVIAAHKIWLNNSTTQEALKFIQTHATQFRLASFQGVMQQQVEAESIRRNVVADKTLMTILDILSDSSKFAEALSKYEIV